MEEKIKNNRGQNIISFLRSVVRRFIMVLKGKWRFINYRKEFKDQYPLYGIWPVFTRYWMGDIWQIEWRGFAISVDMRTKWLADMLSPNRPDRHKV